MASTSALGASIYVGSVSGKCDRLHLDLKRSNSELIIQLINSHAFLESRPLLEENMQKEDIIYCSRGVYIYL